MIINRKNYGKQSEVLIENDEKFCNIDQLGHKKEILSKLIIFY